MPDLSRLMQPFSAHVLKMAGELGWPIRDDMNAGSTEGLAYFRSTVKGGRRRSAADAFLRPALKRGAVTLVKNALVERVLIRKGQAVGVLYRLADQQVIAGAVNSPHRLQLSEIGSPNLLKSHGIEVAVYLGKVGAGLKDHLAISHQFWANEPALNNVLGRKLGQTLVGDQTGRGFGLLWSGNEPHN